MFQIWLGVDFERTCLMHSFIRVVLTWRLGGGTATAPIRLKPRAWTGHNPVGATPATQPRWNPLVPLEGGVRPNTYCPVRCRLTHRGAMVQCTLQGPNGSEPPIGVGQATPSVPTPEGCKGASASHQTIQYTVRTLKKKFLPGPQNGWNPISFFV